ncbi:uncharacterized protein METZ01_LOCUS242314 [marine metagenome]|uniref:Uncharacterized protein n=1 Tax=marine metagenome TaxID=408172 RepID=A0A382HQC1_9ZZZZ
MTPLFVTGGFRFWNNRQALTPAAAETAGSDAHH